MVFGAVVWQQARGPRHTVDAERLARIDGAMAARDWDAATEAALAGLDAHPEERRLYWYLCRVALQKGLPSLALQQLSLASAPLADREGTLYPAPTRDEIEAALKSIGDSLGEDSVSLTNRLRIARIHGAIGDAGGCAGQLRTVASLVPSPPVYGPAARLFVSSIVHLDPEQTGALDDATMGRVLVPLAGSVDTSVGAYIAVCAGGSYFRGKHRFMIGDNAAYSYDTDDSWLCIVTDTTRTKDATTDELRLVPLSGEAETIRGWLEKIPQGAVAFGMASPEAIVRTSKEAISAWRELAGLEKIPRPQYPKAYAFLMERTDSGWRAIERPAAAQDMPAMLICAGPDR